ncbi:MAG TPA: hypothetical protein PKY35_09605 [Candidatus Hydrogenedentes bacterium]|nr:hypothetical protein [Candidatus Hydrogenedentota bacterium]HOL77273.1 hypothetical protein [Candidatus Hydrogenedentota bacterium]HPO86565.1 hypothetical protein [Candidatus Hydrogenedentota bacterium]
MKQKFIRSKFSRRFVLFCEVTGYLLSLGVFVFVLYSAFTTVEVVTKVSGKVLCSSVPLEVDEDFCVLRYLVEQGTMVTTGDVICEGTKDRNLARQVKAHQKVAEALSLLRDGDGTLSCVVETLSSAENLLSPDFQQLEQIRAPESGIFQLQEDSKINAPSPGKKRIAFIIVPEKYEFRAVIPKQGTQRILPGQAVRLSVSDLGRFVGQVADVEDTGDNWNLRVPLQLVERTQAKGQEFPPNAKDFSVPGEAKIVTGKRSLFAEIFVRRS